MIYELNKREYPKIKPLLQSMNCEDHSVLNAIIEGNNRAKVFVDNIEKPKTALVWAVFCMYYFIGDSDNLEFNNYLYSFVTEKLGTENLSMGASTFVYTLLEEEGWKETVDTIFRDKYPLTGFRQELNFNKRKYKRISSVNELPKGYYVKKIDKELLDNDTEETISVDISDFWNSNEEFLEKGIGFCLINEGRIVSSCSSCYVSKKGYEIVINTYDEENRNKGFATAVALEFLDYCVSNGITPHWGAYATNDSSIALAEKLGFEKAEKNIYREFLFDEYYNLINAGYNILRNSKDVVTAKEIYMKAFNIRKPEARDLYNVARGWAQGKEFELAFEFLNKAIDEGFNDINRMKNEFNLSELRERQEWKEFILKIEDKLK
ncbi:GNAT family N-acetyltransferase [Clostridiaceae bacterium M8S5]|nr:GNAT family N-acetyltransferase [Clostridiaceae bacterium M8S5]